MPYLWGQLHSFGGRRSTIGCVIGRIGTRTVCFGPDSVKDASAKFNSSSIQVSALPQFHSCSQQVRTQGFFSSEPVNFGRTEWVAAFFPMLICEFPYDFLTILVGVRQWLAPMHPIWACRMFCHDVIAGICSPWPAIMCRRCVQVVEQGAAARFSDLCTQAAEMVKGFRHGNCRLGQQVRRDIDCKREVLIT